MSITSKMDNDGTHVYFGTHRVAIFTPETDKEAIVKFISLAEAQADTLTAMGEEYKARRDWNYNSNGNGKAWPIFSKLDRIVSKLCRDAGIVDT